MDLLDQSFLSELPVQQRQKIGRKIRQKQIKKYFEFEKSDKGQELEPRRRNKRGTRVHFKPCFMLQSAVDSFDDREVLSFLQNGGNPDFKTGNGTSLLHRCASEDNLSAAEILIARGADVNIQDDDWWTPLHTACSCDSVEVLQLLLSKGANVGAMDVDGYFPVDHAADDSESKTIITEYQQKIGLIPEVLHEYRQRRPRDLMDHIKQLSLAADVDQYTPDGVTLLHIAAANGYRNCIKALMRYTPDVNKVDKFGWTPLHVAARFNQMKAVELLLKYRANPNISDSLGTKPSALAKSSELRELLMRQERRFERREKEKPPVYIELEGEDTDGRVYHEIAEVEDPDGVDLYRINSKTVRTQQSSISKEDELMEAKWMEESAVPGPEPGDLPLPPPPPLDSLPRGESEEDGDGIYVSGAIWSLGQQEQEKGDLMPTMEKDDLVTMETISVDSILKTLQTRYAQEQIYTYIGNVLVALNPFRELNCYAKDISTQYHSSTQGDQLPPHIYGIAQNSYQSLLVDRKSQCHVISGESGSGKTESCKYIVQHLLRTAGSEEYSLNSKINQVNPLLEAFGNSVTVMNNNSSRFGKYVELSFTEEGRIVGAQISEYLLEKSRVVHQGSGERNFHIFYWMMAGLSPEEISVFKLQNMHKFRYLSSTIDSLSETSKSEDKAKFWEVKECLKFIGFSTSDVQNVLQMLSIVLHLGEISFQAFGNNDAAQVSNIPTLQKVSEMMEVSPEELGSALLADYTVTRGEQIKKERTVQQARDCRDALAKAVYARLFSWIVNGINQLIQPADDLGNQLQIGILDIFGFENFPKNSFEQVCINVTNEQIQLYNNDNLFQFEQNECLLEGVPLVDIQYPSNQEILDLFLEKRLGLLVLLDEESNFPKATDKSLATKLHQNLGKKYREFYKTPKDKGLSFTVIHYAGSVRYDVSGMLQKNRDTLPNGILSTMKASNSLLIRELFQSKIGRTGSLCPSARQQRSNRRSHGRTEKKSRSPIRFFKMLRENRDDMRFHAQKIQAQKIERKGHSTMAYHFKNSLNDLMSKLQSACPQFVKCIKPNTSKMPMTFDPQYVLAQLRYTGIAETVKVQKFGYALRLTYWELLQRFPVPVTYCLPGFCPMTDESKCRHVIKHFNIPDVQFGKNKVFLKKSAVERLDGVSTDLLQKIVLAQSVARGFLDRRRTRRIVAIRLEAKQKQEVKHEIEEITKSLDTLDDIINNYDTVFPKTSVSMETGDAPPPPPPPEARIRSCNLPIVPQTSRPHPPPPPPPPPPVGGKMPLPLPAKALHMLMRSQGQEEDYEDDDDLYDDAFSVRPQDCDGNVFTEIGEAAEGDMNGHMHRGLPPTPTHTVHNDPSRTPPCPREMYSQGMYAYIDEHECKKQAPPPPKRNPETRLSTASVSSNSSTGTYEELPLEMHQPYHGHHGNNNQSPHHNVHGSPLMRSKFAHEPQSPSHQSPNRPFSYGTQGMPSPKLKQVPNMNGTQQMGNYTQQNGHHHPSQNVQVLQNYQYTDGHTTSPATSYGKHESAFHPQPKRPPPHGPPPPPPQSPKMQRHSIPTDGGSPHRHVGQQSPLAARKTSQRSQSVPNTEENFPPPPLSLREGYGYSMERPASPPLPPPPPELLANSYVLPPEFASNVPPSQQYQSQQGLPGHVNQQHAMPNMYQQQSYGHPSNQYTADHAPRVSQAPPPPPIATIPKKDGSATPLVVKTALPSSDSMGSASSLASSRETSPSAQDLMGELSKIQLKKTGLKPAVTEPEPTPAPPPPPQAEAPPTSSPPPKEVVTNTDIEMEKQVSPKEFVSLFEKKAEMQRNQGDTSKNSNMEININDIDLSQIPGYTPITKSTPIWKRDMIEKKNQEKLEEYIRQKQKEKEEQEKWKNVPAWKRKLMIEKEREKENKSVEEQKKRAEEELQKKKRAKQAEEEKRQRLKEQQEREKQLEEELKDVPAWKREIMMKKGGAIKNWGDERADINEQLLEEQNNVDDESDSSQHPPQGQGQVSQQHHHQQQHHPEQNSSGKIFVQKATLVLQPKKQQNNEKPASPAPTRRSTDEQKLEEEWDSLPEWKKEIIMKKGGTIRNWGDEREEVNEEDVDQ